jgi:thioredoxin 1
VDLIAFRDSLQTEEQPVLVEFWAPWCAPCRMMAPALDQLGEQYAGKVKLRKINADENQELLRALNIMSIPTVLVFQNGQELHRRIGAQSPQVLGRLFEEAAQGEISPAPNLTMDSVTRMLRLTTGMILGMIGFWLINWPLLILGAAIAFWGVYDRCPIWQTLAPRFKALFK